MLVKDNDQQHKQDVLGCFTLKRIKKLKKKKTLEKVIFPNCKQLMLRMQQM